MSEPSGHRDGYEITRTGVSGSTYELHVRYPYANNLWIHNTLSVNSKISQLLNWRGISAGKPNYFDDTFVRLGYRDAEAREQAIPVLVALIRQLAPEADVLVDGQEHGLRDRFAAWLKAQAHKEMSA